MLKGYEAIYNDGHVEWVGEAPRLSHARVLVVLEEATEDTAESETLKTANGTFLANCIEKMSPEARRKMVEKFGDPVEWQRAQRQDRPLPGREDL